MNRLKQTFGKLKQWFLYIVIGRFYYPNQIKGALNYGYMLGIWKNEAVERMSDQKVKELMDKYISDLDKVNAL